MVTTAETEAEAETDTHKEAAKPPVLTTNALTSSLETQFPSLTDEQMFHLYQEIVVLVWRVQLATYFTGFSDDQMSIILKVIPELARYINTGVYSHDLEVLMDNNTFLVEEHEGIRPIAGRTYKFIVPALRELITRKILPVDFENLPPMTEAPIQEEP